MGFELDKNLDYLLIDDYAVFLNIFQTVKKLEPGHELLKIASLENKSKFCPKIFILQSDQLTNQ